MIKRLFTYMFKVITGLALFAVIGLALVFYTETGRTWLAQAGMNIVATNLDYQLHWQGIRSPDTNQWAIEKLTISKDKVVLFNITDLLIHWRPATVMSGRIILDNIHIEQFTAGELDNKQAIAEGSQINAFPVTIYSFVIEQLKLQLPGAVSPQQYRISGDMELFANKVLFSSHINLSDAETQAYSLATAAQFDRNRNGIFSGRYSEKSQGPVSTILRMPAEEPFATSFNFRTHSLPDIDNIDISLDELAFGFHNHSIKLQGNMQLRATELAIDQVQITVDKTKHTITGDINKDNLDLQLALVDFPLPLLSIWTDYPVTGSGTGNINLRGTFDNPVSEGSLTIHTAYQNLPLSIAVSGSVNKETLYLDNAVIKSRDRLISSVHGDVAFASGQINIQLLFANTGLDVMREFGLAVPEALTGTVNAQTLLTGLWQNPDVNITAAYTGYYKDNIPVGMDITAVSKPAPARNPGDFHNSPVYDTNVTQFDLRIEKHHVSGAGHATLATAPLLIEIDNARINLAGTTHVLNGEISRNNLALNLKLEKIPLDILSPLIELPLTGTASAKIFLGGSFAKPLMTGAVDSELVFKTVPMQLHAQLDASWEWLEIRKLDITSGDSRIITQGGIDLVANESDMEVYVDNIDMVTLARFGLILPENLEGWLNTDFKIKGNLALPVLSGNAEFAGSYNDTPITLSIAGRGNKQHFTIKELELNTQQDGYLSLQGEYKRTAANMELTARNLPAQLFRIGNRGLPDGIIDADMTAQGSIEHPQLTGRLRLLTRPLPGSGPETTSGIEADVKLAEQQLNILLTLAGDNARTGKLDISLPWRRYLVMPDNQPLDQLPLYGSIRGEVYLQELCLLLQDPEAHQCRGKLQTDLSLSDTLAAPGLTGSISLTDGYYDNNITGTSLHNMAIEIQAQGKRLTIVNASTTDGEQGLLHIEGEAHWQGSIINNEINLVLRASDAHMLRRYDMDGTANGILTLTGDSSDLFLSGTLEITPFTLAMEALFQDDIPSLEIVSEHDKIRLQSAPQKKGSMLPDIHMNVELIADQQAFLRGPGLEAELQGKIRIQGTYAESDYRGNFRTIRGSIHIMGKKFKLGEGELRLEGETVSLFIPAVYQGKDLEVHAELSGTMDELALTLSSTPAYPENEIISQLLFGKTAHDISPLQAIRLANAVTMFKRGGRPLFDPLGKIEKTLSIDRLSVEDSSNGNGLLLGVGKYVHEKVYVEVETGTSAGEPWQGNVQIELLPNLNLENSINGESGFGNMELQWKKDY